MKKLALILLLPLMAIVNYSCQYAKANQQVVVSDDCGVSWKSIKPGESVPKGGMNPCYQKVVMPNYPMQGNSTFVSNFANKVRVKFRIDYDYSIVNSLSFIKAAKRLGRTNTDADSDEALNSDAFEGAENSVIDVRLKDVSKSLVENLDLVDADISDLEDQINIQANKVLEERGVHLNFIALTLDLDEQTRQAIDIASAMRIYKAAGIDDLGKQVMAARAGATKISVGQDSKKED